jgi:plasmid maintenance system antidote protein VapI
MTDTSYHPHSGEVLRRAMIEHSWKAEEIAKYFRVTQGEVDDWMLGLTKPTRDQCKILGNLLGFDWHDLWMAKVKPEVQP